MSLKTVCADAHLWNTGPCCCYAATTHLSFLPVVAVAVTVLTMTTQVPPIPPLVTLSVRWWNVTLMAILQVSNFELRFHSVHIGSSSSFICTEGGNDSPISLNQSKVLFHCSVALRKKSILLQFPVVGWRKTLFLLMYSALQMTLGGRRTEICAAEQNCLSWFGNNLPVDKMQYGQQIMNFLLPLLLILNADLNESFRSRGDRTIHSLWFIWSLQHQCLFRDWEMITLFNKPNTGMLMHFLYPKGKR